MCAKLEIELIAASSPQAKGRIERMHGTHQDRLVKKLRRKGIVSHEAANVFLRSEYLPEHNRQFGRVPPAENYHRRAPRAAELDRIFRLESERVISQDRVVRHANRWFQLERESRNYAPARSTVLVREGRHGAITIEYRGRSLRFREIAAPAQPAGKAVQRSEWQRKAVVATVRRKAAANHPWQQAARGGAARKAQRLDRASARPSWALLWFAKTDLVVNNTLCR